MDNSDDIIVLNKLIDEHKSRFISFANSYIQDMAVAEDFVLESYMEYWEVRENLLPNSNIPAYILTVIKHKCLNHLKRKRVHLKVSEKIKEVAEWKLNVQITSLQACNPSELFTSEIQDIVNSTLQELPEQTRKIFIMSRFENKPRKEIAEELDMTYKGVEYHISVAIKALRISLKDYMCILFYFFFIFN